MTNHIAKRKKKKRVRKPLKKSTLPVDPVSLKYQVKLVDGIFNVNDPSENLTPGKYGTIEDYEVELNSAREYTAFVKKIVRLVRGSYEYQEFIKFLGIELQIKNCAMLKGMNTNNVTIEVHHAVVTLYDICDTVIRNTSATSTEDDRFSSISLAGEVCKLHYEGLVPFTPLSKTVHELVHAGKLHVRLSNVYGDLSQLVSRYGKHLRKDLLDHLLNT